MNSPAAKPKSKGIFRNLIIEKGHTKCAQRMEAAQRERKKIVSSAHHAWMECVSRENEGKESAPQKAFILRQRTLKEQTSIATQVGQTIQLIRKEADRDCRNIMRRAMKKSQKVNFIVSTN